MFRHVFKMCRLVLSMFIHSLQLFNQFIWLSRQLFWFLNHMVVLNLFWLPILHVAIEKIYQLLRRYIWLSSHPVWLCIYIVCLVVYLMSLIKYTVHLAMQIFWGLSFQVTFRNLNVSPKTKCVKTNKGCSKSNVTHFGISEIGNTVQTILVRICQWRLFESVYKILCCLMEFCIAYTGSYRINAHDIITSYAPWENFYTPAVAALYSMFHAVFVQMVVRTREHD